MPSSERQIRSVPDVCLHAQIEHEPALDMLERWLAANGMRSAYWYLGGSAVIRGDVIEADEVVASRITSDGWPIPTLIDGASGDPEELTEHKTFPLLVEPPAELVAVPDEVTTLTW